jgi:hypothetical protein
MISSLYFRTHTNVGLEGEVLEEPNDDDDDDDGSSDDDDNNVATESHTLSPSLCASSAVLR